MTELACPKCGNTERPPFSALGPNRRIAGRPGRVLADVLCTNKECGAVVTLERPDKPKFGGVGEVEVVTP